MRQNLIFNVKVIEDSNRGFGYFRRGILKSKRPTGMSLCCLFYAATGYQAPPPIFIDGRDGMGWMGWMGWDGWDGMDGRSTFFFWPIS